MWRPFLLAAALASAGLPLYVHLPRHASTELGLSLSVVAASVLALRLFDFAQDPLLGKLVDRHPCAWPAFAAVGAAGMAVGHLAIFTFAPFPTPVPWFVISLALLVTGFSFLNIQFYSRSFAIAGGIAGLPRLAAWREAGGVAGVLFATLLPDMLMLVLSRTDAYAVFGCILAALTALACWSARPFWRLRPTAGDVHKRSRAPSFSELRRTGCTWLLLLAFLNSLPVAFTSTLFLFFVEDRLALPGTAGPYLAAFFCSAALSTPVWGRLLTRLGPKTTLIGAMLLAIASFCGAAFLPQGAAAGFALICLASGFAVGGDLVVLPAWFAARLGRAGIEAGSAFGLWSATGKLALAIGAGLSLPLLDATGFAAGQSNPPVALGWLTFLYAVLPCALKLFALGLLFRLPSKEVLR